MLHVGACKIDITPYDLTKVRLAGFGFDRRATGVLDPIYGRVFYLSDGETELAVATLDLIGLSIPMAKRIRTKVKGLAPGAVQVTCTHSHSGPDTLGFWGKAIAGKIPYATGSDPQYMEWLEDEVAYALDKAKNLARPASVQVGVDDSPKGKWSKNIMAPDLADERLTALRFEDLATGETIATVVHFGSHPESLWDRNTLVSPDYVGDTMRVVEERLGGCGVFWNGALGGMVTIAYDEAMPDPKRIEWMREAGTALGEMAVGALKKPKANDAAASLAFQTQEVAVPVDNRMFFVAANMGIFERELDRDDLVTEVGLLELGPVRVAFFPGEPLPAVGLRATEVLGGDFPVMVSLANDEIGYVLPAEYFDQPKYKYEVSMSLGRATADRLLAGLARLAK